MASFLWLERYGRWHSLSSGDFWFGAGFPCAGLPALPHRGLFEVRLCPHRDACVRGHAPCTAGELFCVRGHRWLGLPTVFSHRDALTLRGASFGEVQMPRGPAPLLVSASVNCAVRA